MCQEAITHYKIDMDLFYGLRRSSKENVPRKTAARCIRLQYIYGLNKKKIITETLRML